MPWDRVPGTLAIKVVPEQLEAAAGGGAASEARLAAQPLCVAASGDSSDGRSGMKEGTTGTFSKLYGGGREVRSGRPKPTGRGLSSMAAYHCPVVTSDDRATVDELNELMEGADRSLQALVSAYEPLEAAYRDATASDEVIVEVVNTTTLPRAFITTAISAR